METFTITREQICNMTTNERRDYESFVTGCALGFSGRLLGTDIMWKKVIVFRIGRDGGVVIDYE